MSGKKRQDIPTKDRRITVRLSDDQYAVIEKKAEEAGLNLAEYMREMSVHGKVTVNLRVAVDIDELKKLTEEFHKIGSNLNQIAHHFNMGGVHSKAMVQEIHSCIECIMEMRSEVKEMAGTYGNHKTSIK